MKLGGPRCALPIEAMIVALECRYSVLKYFWQYKGLIYEKFISDLHQSRLGFCMRCTRLKADFSQMSNRARFVAGPPSASGAHTARAGLQLEHQRAAARISAYLVCNHACYAPTLERTAIHPHRQQWQVATRYESNYYKPRRKLYEQ